MLNNALLHLAAATAAAVPEASVTGSGLGTKFVILAGFATSAALIFLGVKVLFKNPNRKLGDTGVEGVNVGYGILLLAIGVIVGGANLLTMFGGGAKWLLG